MTNVEAAFKVLEDHNHVPTSYIKSSVCIIWDLKMDFIRKVRWAKGDHRTPDPKSSTYAGLVPRESISMFLTHATMYGTSARTADIRKAYLQAPTSEVQFIVCGDEFGLENVGKKVLSPKLFVVVSVLGETSGATFVVAWNS